MVSNWYSLLLVVAALIVLPAMSNDWNSFFAGFTLSFVLCAAAIDQFAKSVLKERQS